MRHIARKMAAMEGRLVWFGGGFTMGMLFPDRWTCIWQFSNFKSSSTFPFYTSADLLCIYNNIHWICFSTISPLIFILINNLHVVKNPKIFPTVLSNAYVLATFVLDHVMGLDTATSVPVYIRVVDKELYFIFLILFFFNFFSILFYFLT